MHSSVLFIFFILIFSKYFSVVEAKNFSPQIKIMDFQATHSIPSFSALQRGMMKTPQELDQAYKNAKTDKEKLDTVVLIATRLSMQEDTFNKATDFLEKSYLEFKRKNINSALDLLALKGVVQLRQGEALNCNLRHNSHSCIFPLSKEAVHVDKSSVQAAIKTFTEYLKNRPNDLHITWLLNIAHQANGTHPLGMDRKFRIELSSNANIKFPRLKSYAKEVGLLTARGAGGVGVEDFRKTGCRDLILSDVLVGVTYLKNNCDGSFTNFSKESGLSEIDGAINLSLVDFDNDGLVDIYFHRGSFIPMYLPMLQKNLLFKNLGNAHFKDVTNEVGLGEAWTTSSAVSWVDIDNDGWLDLYICNQQKSSDLFINIRGKFSQIIKKSKISTADSCTSVSSGDVNGDGYDDLYTSFWGKGGMVYINQHDKTFRGQQLAMSPLRALNSVFFDFDNDGFEDLFVTSNSGNPASYIKYEKGEKFNLGESIKIFKNNHCENLIDVSKEVSLYAPLSVMGGNVGDFDNDGFVDIFLGTGNPSFSGLLPNKLYLNSDGKKFLDVSVQSGTSNLQKGHGITFADINNDGQLDIFASVGGMFESDQFFPDLFLNPGFKHNWISFRLTGKMSNRYGVGARAKIKVRNSKGEIKYLFNRVGQTSSFGSSPLLGHFGLGSFNQILELEIRWPNKKLTIDKFNDIPINSFIEIREGEKKYSTIRLKSFSSFKNQNAKGHMHHEEGK